MSTNPDKARYSAAEQVGFRVPKKKGEAAVRALSKRGLINRDFRVKPDGAYLLIPLARQLSPAEETEFTEDFERASFVKGWFLRAATAPRTLRETLRLKIPEELQTSLPSSYDVIGDIAVLDLPSNLSDYEKEIAEGIQEINKNVRTVLAKAGAISGIDRILPTRHILGENRTKTVHRESGCRFQVDVAKAYFSPRLSHEHERVVRQVEPGEVITDLFSGVGPFAIMITKRLKDVVVNAVDANPDAVALIERNMALNRVRGVLKVWCGDARDVVRKNVRGAASRVIMNHPSAAREFVDVACMALREQGGIVHYYTFAEGVDCEDRAVHEFESALAECGWRMRWLAEVRRVRGVSPMKWQVVVDAPIAPIR